MKKVQRAKADAGKGAMPSGPGAASSAPVKPLGVLPFQNGALGVTFGGQALHLPPAAARSLRDLLAALPVSANDHQVAGDHYRKHAIQVWDAILAWSLGFLDGNVVKYVVRYRDKGGIEDLRKARHYLDKLIETETNQ
jgi:hypothetical protein